MRFYSLAQARSAGHLAGAHRGGGRHRRCECLPDPSAVLLLVCFGLGGVVLAQYISRFSKLPVLVKAILVETSLSLNADVQLFDLFASSFSGTA